MTTLAEMRPVHNTWVDWDDPSPGRRLRVFARLIHGDTSDYEHRVQVRTHDGMVVWEGDRDMPTFAELMAMFDGGLQHDAFSGMTVAGYKPGFQTLSAIPENRPTSAGLHMALQDLGDEIQEDISEACQTITNPGYYFPGVPDGIEPVSDDQVRLVIWGLQRVLDKETRYHKGEGTIAYYDGGGLTTSGRRPAVPLADVLAWPVQRAIAERRRLRYQQWGITRDVWKRQTWSLWDVPLDADYEPRRALLGHGRGA